jgi:hypothetical protein
VGENGRVWSAEEEGAAGEDLFAVRQTRTFFAGISKKVSQHADSITFMHSLVKLVLGLQFDSVRREALRAEVDRRARS